MRKIQYKTNLAVASQLIHSQHAAGKELDEGVKSEYEKWNSLKINFLTSSPNKLRRRPRRPANDEARDDEIDEAEFERAEEMKQVRQNMKMKSLQRLLFNLIEEKYGEEGTLQPIERSISRITAKILKQLSDETLTLKNDRLRREEENQRIQSLLSVVNLTAEEAAFLADKGVTQQAAGMGVHDNNDAMNAYFKQKEI